MAQTSKLLTVEATAQRLGIGKSTLYRTWRELGLPAYRVGGRLRFRDTELEAWIDNQRALARQKGRRHTRRRLLLLAWPGVCSRQQVSRKSASRQLPTCLRASRSSHRPKRQPCRSAL